MKSIKEILEHAKGKNIGRVAVAAAHDEVVLEAVIEAYKLRIATPVLIGKTTEITRILQELGEKAEAYQIIDAADDEDAAFKAVAAVRNGKANMLMKGLLSTTALMRAVINKETGIRTENIISHVMLCEPADHKMMAITDGGMIPFPDKEKKIAILKNAATVFQKLGYNNFTAALVCGSEVVNPKISSMVDAVEISKLNDMWQQYGMYVYGPVGIDLAVSKDAVKHKHYSDSRAGEADILMVPNYEAGNVLGKSLTLFAHAANAGVIMGAKVPIILVSRADSAQTKLNSIALGAVISA